MKQLWMDWQLFAEGESAPEGAGEGQDSTPPDAGEDFEALIRGRCKEEFDARVKKILDGRLRGLRQENQRLRQAESARQVQALERLERDAAAVRQMYPAFSPEEELRDEDFCRLIAAGVDARTAYGVRHREELLRQAQVQGKAIPRENGTYTVELKLSDDVDSLMQLELMVATEEMAKDLAERFRKDPEHLYARVLEALYEEQK